MSGRTSTASRKAIPQAGTRPAGWSSTRRSHPAENSSPTRLGLRAFTDASHRCAYRFPIPDTRHRPGPAPEAPSTVAQAARRPRPGHGPLPRPRGRPEAPSPLGPGGTVPDPAPGASATAHRAPKNLSSGGCPHGTGAERTIPKGPGARTRREDLARGPGARTWREDPARGPGARTRREDPGLGNGARERRDGSRGSASWRPATVQGAKAPAFVKPATQVTRETATQGGPHRNARRHWFPISAAILAASTNPPVRPRLRLPLHRGEEGARPFIDPPAL
ncbi:hypothetical protein DMH08_25360 [Actinomadura sp. WAC 06369]|nr:hypothetical protein DMH08_25360 [Actinomadura sp. WAC 06369]